MFSTPSNTCKEEDGIQLYSGSPISVSWKSKEFHFQVLGLEESFLIPSPPLTLRVEKLEREPERPPKSMDTLSWKQEKNDPIWRANTHAHTHSQTHTLIQETLSPSLSLSVFPIPISNFFWSLSLSGFMCASFFFVYTWKIASQPHLIIWSWFFTSTTSFPTFFTLIPLICYIITALYHPALHHGKHEGASVHTWILGARTLPQSWLQALTPSCSQAG